MQRGRRLAQRLRARLAGWQRPPAVPVPAPARPPPQAAGPLPPVSIIVVTWNNLALTRQCLASVLADDLAPAPEVVVVDNASQDGTGAYLQDLARAHPGRLRLHLNAQNEGFARACNQGLRLAQGEIIVFLNNDTVVPRGALARLAAYLANPQVGLIGPVTNGAGNEARIEPGYGRLDGLQAFADQRASTCAGLVFDIPMLALYCAAARREVLDQIGPLDEQFGQGMFEDDDLALRVRRAGYRVLCAEDVYVHHWQRAGFKQLDQAAYQALFARNQALFERKWQQRWQPHQSRAQAGRAVEPARFDPQQVVWRCNICGQAARTPLAALTREAGFCPGCASTVRRRAIVHQLARALFGQARPLPDFPKRPDLRGVGLSDWSGYAAGLAAKLDYTNTYYHKAPRLDITDIDPAQSGTLDFLIATDVFEHVAPPVDRAFVNARRLLKPGGVLIFSVPFRPQGETEEHFPELHDFTVETENGQRVLRNTTRDGREQRFDQLVFHGGPGATLEMRVFSRPSLEAALAAAGFDDIRVCGEHFFAHGIYWPRPWSVPIVARAAVT